MGERTMKGFLALLLMILAGLAHAADRNGGQLFVWVELIGFDNVRADYGVGDYLARMERKPETVSLMLDSDRLFLTYGGFSPDACLLPENCA